MSDAKWINTKDLVGNVFRVNDVSKKNFRMWSESDGKYKFSPTPKKGYAPFWQITLDDGIWSASPAQYSQLLLAAEKEGLSDVLGKDFTCQSNDKTGIETRYFFNLAER